MAIITSSTLNPSRITGPLVQTNDNVDGYMFIGAGGIDCDSANMVLTRTAAGDWCKQRTAAGAETYNFRIGINQEAMSRLGTTYSNMSGGTITQSKGLKVTKIKIIHQPTVAALTTHTVTGLQQTAYVANTANAVTAFSAVTGALSTAVQAGGPYLDTITVTTPAFFNLEDGFISFEWQAVMAITGVLKVYGVEVYFQYNWN